MGLLGCRGASPPWQVEDLSRGSSKLLLRPIGSLGMVTGCSGSWAQEPVVLPGTVHTAESEWHVVWVSGGCHGLT